VDDEELYDEEQVDDYRQEDSNIVEVRLSLLHTEDRPSPQHYPTASPPLLVVEREQSVSRESVTRDNNGHSIQHINSTTSASHETGADYNFFASTRKIYMLKL
jgi:hypothetical protein